MYYIQDKNFVHSDALMWQRVLAIIKKNNRE